MEYLGDTKPIFQTFVKTIWMQKTKMKLKIMFDEQYCFPKVLKIQKLV